MYFAFRHFKSLYISPFPNSNLNMLCKYVYRLSPLQIFVYIAIHLVKSEYAMYIAIRQFKSLCILTYANLNLNMLNISPFSNVEATFAEIPGVLETGTIRKIDRRYPFNDACQVTVTKATSRVGQNMSFAHIRRV